MNMGEPSALTHRPGQLHQRVLTYSEFRFWSVELGVHAARLSMRDEHNGEHFAIVPMDGRGKQNREAKYRALEAIEASIAAGNDPGEVVVLPEGRET